MPDIGRTVPNLTEKYRYAFATLTDFNQDYEGLGATIVMRVIAVRDCLDSFYAPYLEI